MQKEDVLAQNCKSKQNNVTITFKTLTETFNHSLE